MTSVVVAGKGKKQKKHEYRSTDILKGLRQRVQNKHKTSRSIF